MASAPSVNLATSTAPAVIKALNYRRVFIERLMLESACAPRCRISLHRQQIFRSPRNSVERSAVFSCRDLRVGRPRLSECPLFGQRDDKVKLRVVALKSGKYICVSASEVILRACSRLASSLTGAKARSSMWEGASHWDQRPSCSSTSRRNAFSAHSCAASDEKRKRARRNSEFSICEWP